MRHRSFIAEAETCRRQAAHYEGQPEAQFLLRVARSFEELAARQARTGRSRPIGHLYLG